MLVFLTGATGFVGGHVLRRLIAEGHTVRALMRDAQNANLPASPEVQRVTGDVVEGMGLNEGMARCDAVIHLVGIIVETGGATFEKVHHIGTRNMVEAAKRNKVGRFVQMSAIGARADGVNEYQTTKWKAEEAVRQSGIPYCILRPSLIFGPASGFVREMLEVMSKAPLFRPVPGDGRPRFRPVSVEDVAACFVQALTNPAATNQTVELGGADELSLDEIFSLIAQSAGIHKRAVHIPMPLMFAGAALASVLPRPPVTVGQLKMLREGSACDITKMEEVFSIRPVGFRQSFSRSGDPMIG